MKLTQSTKVFLLGTLAFVMGYSLSYSEELPQTQEADQYKQSTQIAYTIKFAEGLPSELEKALLAESRLIRLSLNKPVTRGALVRRVQKDQELFEDILAREGYFDARVAFKIVETSLKSDQSIPPVEIIFNVEQGVRYTVKHVLFESKGIETVDSIFKTFNEDLYDDITGIHSGDWVNLEQAQHARDKIVTYFKIKGYPFAEVQTPIADVDMVTKEIVLTYVVTEKALSYIDDTKILGLKHLDQQYVRNRLPWKKNQTYNQKDVDRLKKKLLKTSIIANVKIEPVANKQKQCVLQTSNVTPQCPVTMETTVTEAPPRSIGAGVRYSTATGLGGQVLWHHNNLLGGGEHLGVSFLSSLREQRAKLSLDLPDIGGPENTLSFFTTWLKERTRAYKGGTLSIGSSYEFHLTDELKTSIGLMDETSHITSRSAYDPQGVYNRHLVATPFITTLDTSDDFLDPSKGVRLIVDMTPYLSASSVRKMNMLRLYTHGSVYLPLHQNTLGEGRLVLAGSLKLGTLLIKDFKNEASPNKKFYSGGPGSNRGYGYQKIGPTDVDGVPLGGRSLSEWSGELRFRVNETIGVAGFMDASSVVAVGTPHVIGNSMFYSAGVGLRYYSAIGPIRFDLAFPSKKRKDASTGKRIDAPFHIYISIGQAF